MTDFLMFPRFIQKVINKFNGDLPSTNKTLDLKPVKHNFFRYIKMKKTTSSVFYVRKKKLEKFGAFSETEMDVGDDDSDYN